jgi:hypothetical protein
MQPSAFAPRLLVALLALLVAVLAIQVLLFSPRPLVGLLWPALIACLSITAVLGSARGAAILKYLLYVMSAVPFLLLLLGPVSAASLVRTTLVSAFTLAVALYMARNKEVARFYAASSPRSQPEA